MSIVVAVALRAWGLVISDTRVTVTAEDGQLLQLDSGATSIGLPNGNHLEVPARYRKLFPLSGGWIGAVAGAYPLVRWSFERIANAGGTPEEVGRALEEVLHNTRDRFPDETMDPHVARYAVLELAEHIKLRILWQDGTEAVRTPVEYALMLPPELDVGVNQRLQSQFLTSLQQASVTGSYGLAVAAKSAMGVVRTVAATCASVSDRVEIGVLLRGGRRGYMSGEAQVLAGQDAVSLTEAFEWL